MSNQYIDNRSGQSTSLTPVFHTNFVLYYLIEKWMNIPQKMWYWVIAEAQTSLTPVQEHKGVPEHIDH